MLIMIMSYYEKSWSEPLGPWNMDTIYEISAFVSMLSYIPCESERKCFHEVTNWSALGPEISSEQRNIWPLWLLRVASMQWKEWYGISVWVV